MVSLVLLALPPMLLALTQSAPFELDTEVVKAELRDKGFALVRNALNMSHLPEQWSSFIDEWDHLEKDKDIPQGYRFRRHGKGDFDPTSGTFSKNAQLLNKPYHSPSNPIFGNKTRYLPELREHVWELPLLSAVAVQIFEVFEPTQEGPWHFGIHQMRVLANASMVGEPAPEGLHRDDYEFFAILLLDRHNVYGAETHITDTNKAPLAQFTLENKGDLMIADDNRLLHYVTPIYPLDPTKPAWRDRCGFYFTINRAPSVNSVVVDATLQEHTLTVSTRAL